MFWETIVLVYKKLLKIIYFLVIIVKKNIDGGDNDDETYIVNYLKYIGAYKCGWSGFD